jgi:uncharacterized membrane protein HdeD (DUF308 family)
VPSRAEYAPPGANPSPTIAGNLRNSAEKALVVELHRTAPRVTRMNRIADHWWMFLVRGLTSFVLAGLLLLAPGWSSTATLVTAFAVWMLVDGAGSIAFVRHVHEVRGAAYVARGALGLAAGALALALTRTSSTSSLYLLVGVWAAGTGALEMVFGGRAWSVLPRALGFMVVGAQSLAFGLALLHIPLESVAVLRALLAAFAVVNGIAALVLGEGLHTAAPQHAPAH